MGRKIEVNGSMIDEEYLNENIAEAKGQNDWLEMSWEVSHEHTHCMVCTKPIPENEEVNEKYHRSKNRVMCDFCFSKFM